MILLFSGGIDSYAAWHYLGKPETVYFDLHTPYSRKEIKVVKELVPNAIIEDCLSLRRRQVGEKAYIPFRNLYLAMLAAKYSNIIVIVGIRGDNVSDKNEEIFQDFSKLLSKMEDNINIEVISPFWEWTKEEIVRWFLQNAGNEEDIKKTVSCYSKEDTNYCGACPSCFRKWCAFRINGIDIQFHNEGLMEEYYGRAKEGKYTTERNKGIIQELDAYRSCGY